MRSDFYQLMSDLKLRGLILNRIKILNLEPIKSLQTMVDCVP